MLCCPCAAVSALLAWHLLSGVVLNSLPLQPPLHALLSAPASMTLPAAFWMFQQAVQGGQVQFVEKEKVGCMSA